MILHSHISRFSRQALLLTAVSLLMLLSGCERKPLYLQEQRFIPVDIYDLDVRLLWGLDWASEWQYQWNEELAEYGVLGYTIPYNVRSFTYELNPDNKKRETAPSENIFSRDGGRVALSAGIWYDMLFYSAGTQYTVFIPDDEYGYFNATTRSSTRATYVPATRAVEIDPSLAEMPDSAKHYADYQQPDELFGTFLRELWVSDDPNMYDKEIDEDGNIIYVYKLNALLEPYSFIYLVQVMVINNYDDKSDKPRVKSCRGITLTGLSQGVNLYDRDSWRQTASITTEDIKELQTHRDLILPDGTPSEGDIFAARVLTWGLPGIDPIEARHELDSLGVEPTLQEDCYAGLGLVLRGGYTFSVSRKISEQMARHPAGGVITIVIDASKIPDEIVDERQETGGGGFDASVQGWENVLDGEIVI